MNAELIDRDALCALIDAYAAPWFAMWFYPDALYAKDVHQPRWERIAYDSRLVAQLIRACKPHRYIMRRKVRRMVSV